MLLVFSNFLVPFERFTSCSQSLSSLSSGLYLVLNLPSPFLLFSNALVLFERFAPSSENLWSFSSRFAPCSQILYLHWGGLLLVLKLSSPFRAVCCLFSSSPAFPERLAPDSQISNLFRAVYSLFSSSLFFFERLDPCC